MTHAILTPNLTNVDEDGDNSATFVIEPMHTGYGMTLGNSIRRVLLSSISGAAISAFKVEGVNHEFTTIDGVKEDVVDIMLNLKQVRFKVFSDEVQELRIEKSGSGVVTAGDIKVTGDVEVVNPDQVIATIDGAKTKFVMDMLVETGRGYLTVEERNGVNIPSDMIAIDALFSPVQRVRYNVENTRVGQITNLDKLILNITTDGSITPKDAFEEAAAILVTQYTALAGSTKVASAPAAVPVVETESEDDSQLTTPVEDMGLSARTTNALINNDIHTLQDLVTLGDAELRELKGFGSKALDEVQDKMQELSE
ncbi:DNA-directed RNA polymerase subunit alpha [Candidatus Saccharibacteria bacterium]|jgi:DNA-directed RNA polymerase subunit alpha|nr:DNA-directed RNA polymerase subunit alpha [Candidatus Saccharibacteria bacterium]